MKSVLLTIRILTDDYDADPDDLAEWAEEVLTTKIDPTKAVTMTLPTGIQTAEVTAVGADPDDS